MTAHNHGYDPTCKETRLPDGKMVGECMTTPTTTIEDMRGGEALEISEGISGTWFYHLSRGPRQTHSICGARVMTTKIPLSAWGRVSHLNERYCAECAKHLPTPPMKEGE